MKRILFVAYHFPPHGGAAVQRSLKFVKYLPAFGIEPTVMTGVGATDRRWSPPDETLASEIPPGVDVVRTPWPAGSRHQRLEAEANRLELAARLVKEKHLEAIFVSMSPFSDAAFATALSKRCGIPWVADLRDPWALDEFQVYRTRWHRERNCRAMRRALASAALIVMNTPEAAAGLARAFPEFEHRSISITNGFDLEDIPPAEPPPRNELFTIVHAGFLHAAAGLRQRRRPWQYRLLGRIESGVEILPRSHYYLLQALERWRTEDPSIESHVRFLLVGETRAIDRELVAHSPVASMTQFTGYLPHLQSVRAVRQADLLFLPMHKLPAGKRASIVPGKTYEYIASGRPILAPVPDGDAKEILTRARTGLVCEPDNIEEMVAHLRRQYAAWLAHEPPQKVDRAYLSRFERRELTRQLADHLGKLTPIPPPPEKNDRAPGTAASA
jgi:Glycosyltransferase